MFLNLTSDADNYISKELWQLGFIQITCIQPNALHKILDLGKCIEYLIAFKKSKKIRVKRASKK